MKVLVTGANGFVGSHLLKQLSEKREYSITGLVRETSDLSRLSGGEYDLLRTSLDCPLHGITKGFDAVVHTAASTVRWGNDESVYHTNVDTAINILKDSIQNGVKRFVHYSSTVVYGFSGNRDTDEDAALSPFPTAYCRSKAIVEKEILKYSNDIEIIILRPSNIYGPMDTLFIYPIIWGVDKGILRFFPKAGKTLTSPCYVRNIAFATERALETTEGFGEAYNISDGSDMEWREFLGIIAEVLGRKPPQRGVPVKPLLFLAHALYRTNRLFGIRPFLTPHDIEHIANDYSFSIEKAARLLGYKPLYATGEGIRETVGWYIEYRQKRRRQKCRRQKCRF